MNNLKQILLAVLLVVSMGAGAQSNFAAHRFADIQSHPKEGIGNPEELKYELSGLWSREIDKKNRIIYEIQDDAIHVLSLRGHYFDK